VFRAHRQGIDSGREHSVGDAAEQDVVEPDFGDGGVTVGFGDDGSDAMGELNVPERAGSGLRRKVEGVGGVGETHLLQQRRLQVHLQHRRSKVVAGPHNAVRVSPDHRTNAVVIDGGEDHGAIVVGRADQGGAGGDDDLRLN